jgi:hypothetical protein
LQLPVLPQTLPDGTGHMVAVRGGLLAAMLVQVPLLLASEQLWQPPVQALLQQTPVASSGEFFTQKLEAQSVSSPQVLPAASLSPH